jgi:hypothetical protein
MDALRTPRKPSPITSCPVPSEVTRRESTVAELSLAPKRFEAAPGRSAMQTFVLTALAALTFWSIVYLLLHIFVGDHPNFPGQNVVEFGVNAALLLMVGWMVVGAAYAAGRFRMSRQTAFASCLTAMAAFAYVIASGTHQKILQSPKPLEKKFDRTLYCKINPKASGC